MTQILSSEQQGLIFEVISARISEETEAKKYVIYTLHVRFISGNDDLSPSVIERRYTQFSNLYNALKKDFPLLMANIIFPKKVLTGNFDNELISSRSTLFEQLLKHISSESKLRTSKAMEIFLQEPELLLAKGFIEKNHYDNAYEILENSFKLINKVLSDRSTLVIFTLCRLVGTVGEISNKGYKVKWADLALYRFDGISDSDLLELYVPLIHTCLKIYTAEAKDTTKLENQLKNFQKQGLKDIDKKTNLFTAVDEVEQRISKH